jgi:flagellar hook protein FlgE
MLGAIYTGLSGMNAYSDGLMMISNDVANLNTMGYKSDFLSFDSLYENGSGFLGSNSGGAGYGVSMGSSFTDFSQGTLQSTTNPLDLAIQGNGFLTVLKGGKTYYERTGNFFVDQDGYVSDSAGNHLAILNDEGQPEEFNINAFKTNPPVASTDITFNGNLASDTANDGTATVSTMKVYDSRGTEHDWTVTLTMSDPTNDTWTVSITDSDGTQVGTGELQFDSTGKITGTSTITCTEQPDNADAMNVTLDFSGVSSNSGAGTSTIATASIDGNPMGTLTGVGVTSDGQMELAYSNGKTVNEGYVALANFQDAQQLQRLSGGLYSDASGEQVSYQKSGANGLGTLQSGQVEQSNVNLSNEFGELILIERGFQACSQIVSISNEMIQTLFSMRGQG